MLKAPCNLHCLLLSKRTTLFKRIQGFHSSNNLIGLTFWAFTSSPRHNKPITQTHIYLCIFSTASQVLQVVLISLIPTKGVVVKIATLHLQVLTAILGEEKEESKITPKVLKVHLQHLVRGNKIRHNWRLLKCICNISLEGSPTDCIRATIALATAVDKLNKHPIS